MTHCASIRSALSQYVGLNAISREHLEMGASRMQRDAEDCKRCRFSLKYIAHLNSWMVLAKFLFALVLWLA